MSDLHEQIVRNEIIEQLTERVGGALIGGELLREYMGELYNDAQSRGDGARVALIERTWDGIQRLDAQHGALIDLTVAARVLAEDLQSQRDEIADELSSLEHAIENEDESQPLVATLIENVRDEAMDWFDDSGYYHDAAVEKIVDDMQYLFKRAGRTVSTSQVYEFFYLLDTSRLSDEQTTALADLIDSINTRQKYARDGAA